MNDLPAGLARERAFLGTSAVLFVGSLGVTIYLCKSMPGGMPMPGGWTMSMAWMKMAGQTRLAAATSFVGMWLVMMVAMMLPSLAPMLLRYRRSIRGQADHLGGLTTIVGGGYFFVWSMLGVVVYPVGVSLSAAEMRWPVIMRFVPLATGVVLLLAGGIQLTAWKARRLRVCRDAPACGSASSNAVTAWTHGLRLGASCVLCCAGFMAVLLVAGVMSLTTMAVVTAAITVERFAHNSERASRAMGAVMIAVGVLVVARALWVV